MLRVEVREFIARAVDFGAVGPEVFFGIGEGLQELRAGEFGLVGGAVFLGDGEAVMELCQLGFSARFRHYVIMIYDANFRLLGKGLEGHNGVRIRGRGRGRGRGVICSWFLVLGQRPQAKAEPSINEDLRTRGR